MILRKLSILVLFGLALAITTAEDPSSPKTYDMNDWIPIAHPEKKATGRVLNLADPPQKNFFPEDNYHAKSQIQPQYQQYLRETTAVNPYAAVRQPHQPPPQQLQQQQALPQQPSQQPYRFELATNVKQPARKPVEIPQAQPQYYLQAQPVRQQVQEAQFPARQQVQEAQFPVRQQIQEAQFPVRQLQKPGRQPPLVPQIQQLPEEPAVQQPIPQTLRQQPKSQYQQYLVQPQQYFQQPQQQYHTIPQEYLNPAYIQQAGFYDQAYHTIPETQYSLVPNETEIFQQLQPIADKTVQDAKLHQHQDVKNIHLTQPQKEEKENVQLVYVPLENLKQKEQQLSYQRPQTIPPPTPQQYRTINHKQQQIKSIENDFAKQALEAHKLQQQFQQQPAAYALPVVATTLSSTSTSTTTKKPTSKKRKPHQPPLAVYMGGEGHVEVSDVLALLKDAKSIDVQDSFGPESPQVFVGPSTLDAPDGYAKFELPYLSSLDNNRVERKVDQLPFFVAPLSYNAPQGYSKIPLPSPHVGSVVVSTKDSLHDKNAPAVQSPVRQNSPQEDQRTYYVQTKPPTRTYVSSTTTTQRPIPPRSTSRPSPPISQVVNQYEIDEINSQFIPPPEYQYDTFPSKYAEYETIPREQTYPPIKSSTAPPKEVFTTPRPTRKYSPTPTQNSYVESSEVTPTRYTVLEEFNPTQRSSTPNYKEFNNSPDPESDFYATIQPQPIYSRKPARPESNNQHILNQEMMDQQILRQRDARPTEDYIESSTRVKQEQYPLRVPATEPNRIEETVKPKIRQRVKPADYYIEDVTINNKYESSYESTRRPQYTEQREEERVSTVREPQVKEVPIQNVRVNNEHVQQDIPTVAQEEQNVIRNSNQYLPEAYYEQANIDNSRDEEYGNYNLPPLLPPVSQTLPGLINELQDQSLKSLLVPALLAPTTQKSKEYNDHTERYVEVTSTTAAPVVVSTTQPPVVETTTQRRTRGRQRGRYTTAAPVTSDTTRRNLSRGRRPYTSRTKDDSVSSTTEYSAGRYQEDNYSEAPKKTVTITRQRFRTRGRPVQNEVTERSTTARLDDITASTLRNRVSYPSARYEAEEQSIRPQVGTYDEQYVINSYQPVYNVDAESDGLPLNKIAESHSPSTDRISMHSTRQYYEEPVETTTNRLRSRIRSRTRPTTTTTTTTPAPVERNTEEASKEFYGFFRTPSFKNQEVSDTTRDLPKYSSTYVSSTSRPTIQYPDEAITGRSKDVRYIIQEEGSPSSTPVQFVGEIRPKYFSSSTSRYFEVSPENILPITDRYYATTTREVSTEAPKVNVRGRVRLPSRLRDNNEDQSTKSTRVRTRGKIHYKAPVSASKAKDSTEDDDVEGGNYPALYLKSKDNYTPRPSFQITVDPSDDQVPHSSIYRPKYLPQNPEDSQGTGLLNDIPNENKQISYDQYSTETAPTALPFIYPKMIENYEEPSNTQVPIVSSQEFITMPSTFETSTMFPNNIDYEDITTMSSYTYSEEPTTELKRIKSRRKGVWKLVKQRPVDVFEGAESQGLSVINNLDSVDKTRFNIYNSNPSIEVKETTTEKIETTTNAKFETETETSAVTTIKTDAGEKEEGIFDSLYEMFGMTQTKDPQVVEEEEVGTPASISTELPITEEVQTVYSTVQPAELSNKFIITEEAEELTTPSRIEQTSTSASNISNPFLIVDSSVEVRDEELVAVQEKLQHEDEDESQAQETDKPETTTAQPMSYVTPMSLHTWTSTSTEISHETEICYKGKCVKSKESKGTTVPEA